MCFCVDGPREVVDSDGFPARAGRLLTCGRGGGQCEESVGDVDVIFRRACCSVVVTTLGI